jgi:hypothetical protein
LLPITTQFEKRNQSISFETLPALSLRATRVYHLLCCSCCSCDIRQKQPKSSAKAVYIIRLDHQSSNLQFANCNIIFDFRFSIFNFDLISLFRPISTGFAYSWDISQNTAFSTNFTMLLSIFAPAALLR